MSTVTNRLSKKEHKVVQSNCMNNNLHTIRRKKAHLLTLDYYSLFTLRLDVFQLQGRQRKTNDVHYQELRQYFRKPLPPLVFDIQ